MYEVVSRTTAISAPAKSRNWIFLAFLVVVAISIYYPEARHNLPVAINVDDRTSLAVLLRFHQGSANPKFFMYPTLYYYLTYAITAWFGFTRILLTGHLFNLCLLGVTAWLSFLFCLRQFKSTGAGVVAAVCVLLSPTLVLSGRYLCTDILLSAMTILSLDLLMTYFHSRTSQNWLFAMLAVGCAISAKYTAAILFLVYCAGEIVFVFRERNRRDETSDRNPDSHFTRSTVVAGLVTVGSVSAIAAIFFPVQAILHFVALHRTNLVTRSTQDYFEFLNRFRKLTVELCIASAILLAAAWKSRTVYACLSLKRIYFGVLIVAGVFLMTTPYSLFDPEKFLYDIGALLRANVVVVGSHQQWGNYWHWLFDNENKVLVSMGIAGFGLMVYRLSWLSLTPTLFAVLHVFVICSAHRGFERYLDPLLPLLYCGTGLVAWEIWQGSGKIVASNTGAVWWRVAMCLVAAALLTSLIRTVIKNDRSAADNTAYYTAYQEVLKDVSRVQASEGTGVSGSAYEGPRVLYAGFAPSVELNLAGVKTQEVSWSSLQNGPIGDHLECSDLLILNEISAAVNHMTAAQDASVDVLLDDPRGEGQMVLRRRGCH